jgi:hypothetical protein
MSQNRLDDFPFRKMELLEERDELLQNQIPPLENALHEAETALERARIAPLNTIPRRSCQGLCHPCPIREARFDCAETKCRECVFAAEFAAFRSGQPDTPIPAREYREIPPPDLIRTHLVRAANYAVRDIRKKLVPLYRRLGQIHAELAAIHHQ